MRSIPCLVWYSAKALKDASHADRLPDVAEADTLARMYAAYLESPRRERLANESVRKIPETASPIH